MNENDLKIDSVIVRQLAQIHLVDLPLILTKMRLVLSSTTGIELDHDAFAPLAVVWSIDELARVNWEELYTGILKHTCLPQQSCMAIIEHIRLFAEHAVLYHCFCRSKSASTLLLLHTWPISPHGLSAKLEQINDEFDQALKDADTALHKGRASMTAFRNLVLKGGAFHELHALLERADACYSHYLQALQQADQLAGHILRYLTQSAEETRSTSLPAWHAA
jgi:hypothetical protein